MTQIAFNLKSNYFPFFFRMLFIGCLFIGCTESGQKPSQKVVIYTSIYKEVINQLSPSLKKEFPDLEVIWFQGGSETIATKVQAELLGGKTQADLILTSDPLWYFELKSQGHLLKLDTPQMQNIPPEWREKEGYFVSVRTPVMILASNDSSLKLSSIEDLQNPEFKDQLMMPSPLESGTAFLSIALTSQSKGWEYFKRLRANNLIASGGNSVVIQNLKNKDKKIGWVLLENVLAYQKKATGGKSPLYPLYVNAGVIPIPSPMAILKTSANVDQAKRVYNWFLEQTAQKILVENGMYSPVFKELHPEGAPPWKEIESKTISVHFSKLEDLYKERDKIKKEFTNIILR